MEINHILQSDYLDLLFDNRNKQYGSYELRKHYSSRMLTALGIMLLAVSSAVVGPYLYSRVFPDPVMADVVTEPKVTTTEVTKVIFEQKRVEVPPPKAKAKVDQPNQSVTKTTTYTIPKVVSNNNVVKPITPTESITDAVGLVTNPGNNGTEIATTTKAPVGPPGGVTTPETETGVTGGGAVRKEADVMPEYPGGMQALLSYLQKNIRYPSDAVASEKQGRVVLRFVVNEFGAIEDIQVVRSLFASCDKEAIRVVKAMKAWKPGLVAGKPVKVYYTLPVTFMMN